MRRRSVVQGDWLKTTARQWGLYICSILIDIFNNNDLVQQAAETKKLADSSTEGKKKIYR